MIVIAIFDSALQIGVVCIVTLHPTTNRTGDRSHHTMPNKPTGSSQKKKLELLVNDRFLHAHFVSVLQATKNDVTMTNAFKKKV